MIDSLPRVVPSPPERPRVGHPEHPMRRATRLIAFDPTGWNAELRTKVTTLFDDLAPGWDATAHAAETQVPLRDALDRGGPLHGPCVEVGAGTGRATGALVGRFGPVLAVDVAMEMLRRFQEPTASPVRADGGTLPVRSASVGTLVLVNAFLFPTEVDRVLAPDGAVVWVNTLADDTPIHLPVDDVVAALPGSWRAVTSQAGWGLWGVVRRGS
jgi:hypothetical protein